jgi:hypothetical protein
VKLADFDFDTHYATCDGKRITITRLDDDTEPRNRTAWYESPCLDQNTGQPFTNPKVQPTHYRSGPVVTKFFTKAPVAIGQDANDPWGACHGSNRRSRSIHTPVYADGRWVCYQLVDKKPGLVVTVWDIDSDGELVPDRGGKAHRSHGQMLYTARDIPGTWLEYMTLHAEDVKSKAVSRAISRIVDEYGFEFRNKGIPAKVHQPYGKDHATITVTLEGDEALKYLRGRRAKGLKNAVVVDGHLTIKPTKI